MSQLLSFRKHALLVALAPLVMLAAIIGFLVFSTHAASVHSASSHTTPLHSASSFRLLTNGNGTANGQVTLSTNYAPSNSIEILLDGKPVTTWKSLQKAGTIAVPNGLHTIRARYRADNKKYIASNIIFIAIHPKEIEQIDKKLQSGDDQNSSIAISNSSVETQQDGSTTMQSSNSVKIEQSGSSSVSSSSTQTETV